MRHPQVQDMDSGGLAPRRRFLNWLLSLSGLAAFGSALYPVLRFLTPLPRAMPGGIVEVPEEKLPAITGQPHFTILRAAQTRLIVLQDAKQRLRALSAVCTHEGCTVQFLDGEQIIWCACHNGRFDLDGRVLSGPPPRPLPRYGLVEKDDGRLSVDLRGEGTTEA